MVSRRTFVKVTAAGVLTWWATGRSGAQLAFAESTAAALDVTQLKQFSSPLLVPPVMPRARRIVQRGGKNVDYYEIAVRQFEQQMLPAGHPRTKAFGYGAVTAERKGEPLVGLFHAPSLTIEARTGTPVRVKWINELVDSEGNSCLICSRSTRPCTGPTRACSVATPTPRPI